MLPHAIGLMALTCFLELDTKTPLRCLAAWRIPTPRMGEETLMTKYFDRSDEWGPRSEWGPGRTSALRHVEKARMYNNDVREGNKGHVGQMFGEGVRKTRWGGLHGG